MKNTWIIAKREFLAQFNGPIGYVVLALSLLVAGALVFMSFWTANRAELQLLFQWMAFIMPIFFLPAITMRLFAEEKRMGTIELLITLPVRDIEVVMGKFLAALAVVFCLFVLMLTYPMTIGQIGSLDVGPVLSGFFGLLLTSAAGIAVGLWASSITQDQVVAFMVTSVTLTFITLLEYLGQFFGNLLGNQVVSDSIQFLSFHHRVMQFSQGLIDVRSVVYVLSVAVFFLVLTVRSFESRKWK